MTNNEGWAWADEDDDLQKALRASLADAEGNDGVINLMDDDTQDGIPADVQSSFQRVVNSWERSRRVLWNQTNQALEGALQHVDHPSTLTFVNQMIP